MGNGDNLQGIMNDVSRRLDGLTPISRSPRYEGLSEIEAFMTIDPLLADLNKHYLDAKANRIKAVKDFGAGDGMTEMAILYEDSAWCAVQTRYMELRTERQLMAQAQQMMEEKRREEASEEKAERKRKALQMFEDMQIYARMHEKAPKDFSLWWWAAFALFGPRVDFFRNHHPSYAFNRFAA
jgi:hypothetical protein